MMEMLIVIRVKEKEKEDLMKMLIDTFDYWGYTYLYKKNTNELLLVNKHGFATFEYNDSFYKDPQSGEEYGEMVITLTSTEKQLPLLAQDIVKDLMVMGLNKNVLTYYINERNRILYR